MELLQTAERWKEANSVQNGSLRAPRGAFSLFSLEARLLDDWSGGGIHRGLKLEVKPFWALVEG